MAKDGVRDSEQIKAYPRGNSQGGRALQAVRGSMDVQDGTDGSRTVIRETPEGRAIARTRDHMPMVEVEKQGCEIGVDHGVIDMHTVAPLHPDAYKDGNLYATPFVATHVAGAAEDDPDRPIVDEIEPPDSVKGKAPADGDVAKSLTAGKNADKRGLVYNKKVMMGRCPSSIFTGRTRLWVQALYGRHDELSIVTLADALPSATPALVITSHDDSDIWITTSTGVYLDPVTAEHWMISVTYDKVTIFPMETTEPCIDELRSFLLDPAFPIEDKERVETYILADSKPANRAQVIDIPATPSYSMGYGWHFNWAGDRCDIVLNAVVPYGGGGNHNASVHWRLLFAKDENNIWTATRQLVEGPIYWKSLRHIHPIAEPEWGDGVLLKFGAHLGPDPYGNAPFYVFYDRDDLKVCRYSAHTTDNVKSGVTREPPYYNPGTDMTIGTDALNYRTRNAWTGSHTTFTCDSVTVSFAAGSYVEQVITRTSPNPGDISQKVAFGPSAGYLSGFVNWPIDQPGTIPMNSITDEYWGTISVYSGAAVSGWPTGSFGPFNGTTRLDYGVLYCRAYKEAYSAAVTQTTQFIAVVPFGDAEAIYLYGHQETYTHETGTSRTDRSNWFEYNGEWEPHSIMAIAGRAGTDGSPENLEIIDREVTTSATISKLVSSTGVFDATFPGSSGFWAPVDYVPQQYYTRSSASGNAIRSESTGVSSGNPGTTDANIYVGWA